MVSKELLDFIQAELDAGQTRAGVIDLLVVHGGWDRRDVEEALDTLPAPVPPIPSPQAASAPFSPPAPSSPEVREKNADPLGIFADIPAQTSSAPASARTAAGGEAAASPSISAKTKEPDTLPPGAVPVSASISGAQPSVPPSLQIPSIPAHAGQVKSPPATTPIIATAPKPLDIPPASVRGGKASPPPLGGATFRHSSSVFAKKVMPSAADMAAADQVLKKEVKSVRVADAWASYTPEPPVSIPAGETAAHLPQAPSPSPQSAKPSAGPSLPPVTTTISSLGTVKAAKPVATPLPATLRKADARAKKRIFIVLAVLALFGALGAGAYMFGSRGAMKQDSVFATMYASLPGVQSLKYKGTARIEFTGEVIDAGKSQLSAGQTGAAKLAVNYEGKTDISEDGGDGNHRFGIVAKLSSGNINIDIESAVELRVIGDTYFIKISDPPEISGFDLSMLKNYWLSISRAELKRRAGISSDQGEDGSYGSFGAPKARTGGIGGLLGTYPFLQAAERIGEEEIAGVLTHHYRFAFDAEQAYRFLNALSEDIRNEPLLMTEEERARLLAFLRGMEGDIWIDQATYLPRRIVLNRMLDHVVSGIKVNGYADTEQEYSEYNVPVSVAVPEPVIAYEDFAAMIEKQAAREEAQGDDRRAIDIESIQGALSIYYEHHGARYPLSLDALVSDGILRSVPSDPAGKPYPYAPYVAAGKADKNSRCKDASLCVFYHLGATLDDPKRSMLAEDSDLLGDVISGNDKKGCAGEAGKACYDVTPLQ